MPNARDTVIELEKRFWQSMVDGTTDTALDLLAEPSVMVSSHGAMQFDHAGYRRMAEGGSMVLKSFELSDFDVLFPNEDTAIATYRARQSMAKRGESKTFTQEMEDSSTWVRQDGQWRCVAHTETPLDASAVRKPQ